MARINAKKTLTAVVLAAATFATPALAHAGNYSTTSYKNDCATNTQDQVIAGTIGAVLGGVLGSQVSGNGARTEGSVIGAVLGGAAGAAIADGQNDCDKLRDNSTYRTTTNRSYDTGYNRAPVVTNVGLNSGYRTASNNRNYNRGYAVDTRLDRVDRRIDYLRAERSDLKRQARYANSRRAAKRIDKRLYDISYELDQLKRDRKAIKKSQDRNRSVRNRW
ncbi:glycine zipper 2TM domain-containing protein [Hellea sp.]|nr:glycine zipper 2TM domain-containing protein [Hellea sp.]